MGSIDVSDLIITVAYFSIPLQIIASLWQYPRLAVMPLKIVVLLVLFALFIFLCGAGHLLRCLNMQGTASFRMTNIFTAIVSLVTALYLLPLIPNLLGIIDQSLKDAVKLNKETAESKAKLLSFMAFLCHEIRNPLFAITSSASFLSDTDMTEEQETGVGSILDSSLLMLRLVNDVLDLSKIDAGKLELEERYFDMHRLLENLEENMRLQIHQKHGKNVRLEFVVAENVPHIVYGDSIRMLQVLYNLVSNACKFTSQGKIKMTVSVCEDVKLDPVATKNGKALLPTALDREHADHFSMGLLDSVEKGIYVDEKKNEMVNLKFVVADTGVGIPLERIRQIFEPFSQAKLSDYRMHGGTGLGLSIIASIVKMMGGSISVDSKLGHGSTFTLRLPIPVALDQNRPVDDSMRDMTDPLLSTQRLPVYQKPAEKKQRTVDLLSGETEANPNDATPTRDGSTPTPPPQQPLFNTNERPESAPGPFPKLLKPKDQKPKLPNFKFAKGKGVVLVVDDNNVNRKILGRMLSFYNLEYVLAVNGEEAVEQVRRSKQVSGDENALEIELVFMDLSMPVMDGFEATKTIRDDGVKIPIVALTANALSQEKQRAYEAGATQFKTKPILREDLHAICTQYLLPNGHEARD